MSVAYFDPSIASENLGDLIIRDAVLKEFGDIFSDEQIVELTTQEVIGKRTHRLSRSAKYRIIGGTNLLSSFMLKYRQWQIGIRDARKLGPITLMGVGWWQYQPNPDLYTRMVLRTALSESGLHSVRDNYTREKLASIGINNVVNTSCPTTWQLTPEHCAMIPRDKGREVVLTLTDYNRSPQFDNHLIATLLGAYDAVYFWPQGTGDLEYGQQLGLLEKTNLIGPTLAAYDAVLDQRPVDFFGTRLHAGIRAMQKGRRATIVAIDNRSSEISRDIGLPTVHRDDLPHAIDLAINGHQETKLSVPFDQIERWKAQFNNQHSE
ncbi:polysaccharide pyruvyl transferase family protein [Croceicoccus ponticola]|uniref:polysaccharide pyruvyl transferase family protein n=1 Tax=Croceicoccus ponticola TaxID=2217664 RepID=UPI0013E322C6|nr:polysaccharide pyruvyl transferase family protein [Croceicoccus ponticola]